MTTTGRALALVAALSIGLALGGCAGSAPGSPGGPVGSDGSHQGSGTSLAAAWLDDGRSIGIVTWGSSTCTPMAGEPSYADGVLTVRLSDVEGRSCTKDHVPRATVAALPQGIDPSRRLPIVVTGSYAGETALAGDAALTPRATHDSEYLPTAGWFSDDGFLLLTWGSSTCAPQLTSAQATGAAEVTATFAAPPADQVCTADMAQRVTVGTVTGVEAKTAVRLVLKGGGFDAARLPLSGSR